MTFIIWPNFTTVCENIARKFRFRSNYLKRSTAVNVFYWTHLLSINITLSINLLTYLIKNVVHQSKM